CMPYHQPLPVARAYLAHLGVTRLALIQALGRPLQADEAATAEALGMSPDEFAHVARPTSEPWRHLGFEATAKAGGRYLDALSRAPIFLERTGLSFQQLIDIVSTRFVNGDDRIKLETPVADCDPARVSLRGLDEERIVRILRLARLQRRLRWSFADL